MASGQENKKGFFHYPEAKEGCVTTYFELEENNVIDDLKQA